MRIKVDPSTADTLICSFPNSQIIQLYEGGYVGPIFRENDAFGVVVLNHITFIGLATLLVSFDNMDELNRRIAMTDLRLTKLGAGKAKEIQHAVCAFGNKLIQNSTGGGK